MQTVINKKIEFWREKLIDLTKRNKLLHFKPRATAPAILVVDEKPAEIFKLLVQKNTKMEFKPYKKIQKNNELEVNENDIKRNIENQDNIIDLSIREFELYDQEKLDKKYIDKYLQTSLEREALSKKLLRINSLATSALEEQGYNVLYLALGALEWSETDDLNTKFNAPLLLIPVELKRQSVQKDFQLEYSNEEIIINPALAVKLNKDFGINISDIEIDDENGHPLKIYQEIQSRINHKEGWRIIDNIYLGLFTFSKFIMYKDLEQVMDTMPDNDVLKKICGIDTSFNKSIDDVIPWEDAVNLFSASKSLVLDADSSQQRAIAFVKEGHDLVIEGPLGLVSLKLYLI